MTSGFTLTQLTRRGLRSGFREILPSRSDSHSPTLRQACAVSPTPRWRGLARARSQLDPRAFEGSSLARGVAIPLEFRRQLGDIASASVLVAGSR
jgi:hypothetical protein